MQLPRTTSTCRASLGNHLGPCIALWDFRHGLRLSCEAVFGAGRLFELPHLALTVLAGDGPGYPPGRQPLPTGRRSKGRPYAGGKVCVTDVGRQVARLASCHDCVELAISQTGRTFRYAKPAIEHQRGEPLIAGRSEPDVVQEQVSQSAMIWTTALFPRNSLAFPAKSRMRKPVTLSDFMAAKITMAISSSL